MTSKLLEFALPALLVCGLAGCVANLPQYQQSTSAQTSGEPTTNPATANSGAQAPALVTHPLSDKLTAARFLYGSAYPDAKPVEFRGESDYSRQQSGFMDSMTAASFGGSGDLGAYYKDVKKLQGTLVSDEKYSYFFEYLNGDKQLASMQVDKLNIESIKAMIRDGKGILEPVLVFDSRFTLSVDVSQTRFLHAKLGKVLALMPLEDSLRFGELLVKRINEETARRAVLSYDQLEMAVRKRVVVKNIFEEIEKLNERSTAATEYQTIYNVRFKELFRDRSLGKAAYVVLTNKDNMFVDRLPNFVNQRIFTEKYIEQRMPLVVHTSGKQEVFRVYLDYERSVNASLNALKSGYQYANTSIQLLSMDRVQNITNTGTKLIPDLKVTVTDIPRLDAFLMDTVPAAAGDGGMQARFRECHSMLTTISEKCIGQMMSSYKKLWDPLTRPEVKREIDKTRSLSLAQYEAAVTHLLKSKEALQIAGAMSSRRLK